MATEALDPPTDATAAWNELAEQSLLTFGNGERECGRSTHAGLVGACQWCGAAL